MEKPETCSNPPTISIIIPAYNQALYVSKSIQSVLDQTYPDFELIVVDDGSTDETPQILEGIQDPRVRIIWQPNAGLSAARNTGLLQSSAPLVSFLDSDDLFLPDKLEVLSRFLEVHPEIGLVAGKARYVDQLGNTILGSDATLTQLTLPKLLFENPICVSSILMRRIWFGRVGVFDETLRACEDWDLWLRLLAAGCQMVGVDHYVVDYRIHPGQMTNQSGRMRKAIISVLDKLFNQPELPDYLSTYKIEAYATGLIHAAAFSYISGEFDKGQLDLTEAVHLDPTLKYEHYKRLIELLVGWSSDPRSASPAGFLQRIISNPPPSLPGLSRQLRRAMADIYLGSLFSSSQENWRSHRGELFKAILYKPDWLLNRGVLRMIADSWLH